MGLSVWNGTVSQKTSTGTQAYTGVGFQPKALILFGNSRTSNGTHVHAQNCLGFVASTSDRRYMSYVDKDAVTVTVARRRWSNNKAYGLIDVDGTLLCEADLSSFDSDGFTLDWTTADATARQIHVIALGGTDITDVVGGETTRPTSTGSQAISSLGLAPGVGFFFSNDASATGNDTDAHYSFGFGADSSNRGLVMVQSAHDLGDSEASRYYSSTQIIGSHNTSSGSGARALADLTSLDSDGFTLNWGTVNANAYYYGYLLLEGSFTADVLAWTKITTTGADAKTGVGFAPSIVVHQSHANTSTGSSAHARYGLGVATGSSASARYRTVAFGSRNAGTSSICDSDLRTDSTLDFITEGTPAINDRATHTSVDSDGFTLNWGTSSASARRILTLSLGAGAGGATQDIAPSGISTAEAFGTAVITTGAVDISPSSIATAEAFGTAIVASIAYILPDGITTAEAFGTAVITPGTVSILPSSITTAEAFGTAVITPGAVSILPSSIATAEAFGSATVGAIVYILPTGISSAEAFGTAVITPGSVAILPSGISSAETFGTATVSSVAYILPSAIATAEAFGTAVVSPGTAYILPSGIASAEAFGAATINSIAYILPSGISTAEAFGTHAVALGAGSTQNILPGAIATAEAFGTAVITTGAVYVLPSSIATAEAFGTAVVSPGAVSILPSSISTLEVFGTATISPGSVNITPSSITTAEAFGTATLTSIAYILPSGISTAESFGTAIVAPGVVYILPSSIATAEAFGTAWIATAAGVPVRIIFSAQRFAPIPAKARRFLLNGYARKVEFEAIDRVFIFHARKTKDF